MELFALQNEPMNENQLPPDPFPQQTIAGGETLSSTVIPAQQPTFVWSQWLSELWQTWGSTGILALQVVALLGTGSLLLLTMVRALRFERLLRLAQPAQNDLQKMTQQMGASLGLPQTPSVLIVPGKVGPLLWHRWTKPVIVLPAGLLENMTGQELQTVLAHELTHYRRGDHLWRYLELAAVACYWWLPSAWWASRRLRQVEEECCDAGVVASLPDGVASYASALVRSLTYVTEPSSPCPALSSGLGPVTLLKRRLTMLQTKVERRLGVRGWLLLAAVAALALPIGISVADDDPPTPPSRREGGRTGERRDRNIPPAPPERDDDTPTPPRAAAAPVAPRAPQGTPAVPSTPARPPVGVAYTTPPAQAAVPATPSPFGSFQGNPEEMRAGMEMAVREAELNLKAQRIKMRQAESALKSKEMAIKRISESARNGNIPEGALNEAKAELENVRAQLELAQVEVERGELAVEQAKRRMSMQPQMNRGMQMTPPSSLAPAPSASGGVPGGMPPGGGLGGRGGSGGGGGTGGSFSGTISGGNMTAEERAKRMFENMDKDKSGRVTKEQFPGFWRDRFDEFDKNRDGFVTFEEFKAGAEKLQPRAGGMATGGMGGAGGPGTAPGGGGGGFGGGFGGSMGGSFGGGRGGPGASAGAPPADPFFRNFDKQNTGKIRKEDVPEWMRERFFEMLDTNRDGVVDHDEFTANYNKLWETPNSRRAAAGALRTGGRGDGDGRGEAGVARTSPGRGEGVARGEAGGRGEGAAGGPGSSRTRPAGDRDPRDNRIEQLEQELREMRKALEGLKGKDGAKP
ncbi:MAG: M56 family metallopeptidase [Gemmatales bacterium]